MSDTDVGHGALRGQRVLVPRTPDRAGELVTLLQSAGAEVVGGAFGRRGEPTVARVGRGV